MITFLNNESTGYYECLSDGVTKHGLYVEDHIYDGYTIGQYDMGQKTGKWVNSKKMDNSLSTEIWHIDWYKNGLRNGICVSRGPGYSTDTYETYENGLRHGRCAQYDRTTRTIKSAYICDQGRYMYDVDTSVDDINIFIDALY